MRLRLLLTGLVLGLLSTTLTIIAAPTAQAIPEGPEHPSAEWTQRELTNYLRTRDEANRELTSVEFQARLTEQAAANLVDYAQFQLDHGFINVGNLCATWAATCGGDPFRYPGVDPFYDTVGSYTETLFYDRDCARISGRVWAPLDAQAGDDLPGVVITNGSIQASEPLYWWFAQALVSNGYIVMTWDPRGQGRSDTVGPNGELGTNLNPAVFPDGTVDAIDFLHSTPDTPYPHNVSCAASVTNPLYALPAAAPFNPAHAALDRERLGLAGHSLGGSAVFDVQAMDPWEGQLDTTNPVDVIVAWDGGGASTVTPRVPSMYQSSEYGIFGTPFTEPPAVDGNLGAFATFTEAGVPVVSQTILGSTHFEWSQIPTTPVPAFSSTSWEDWGLPMAEHYSLAWMDRWLKESDEVGFADADARLLDDAQFCERHSFYLRSARDFAQRDGTAERNEDIRASCVAALASSPAVPLSPEVPATPVDPGSPVTPDSVSVAGATTLPSTGGDAAFGLGIGVALAGVAAGLVSLVRRRRSVA